MVIIHLATVALHAVADHEIVYMQQQVVCADLFEGLLRERDVGSLVFNDHAGVEPGVIEHGVGAELLAVAHLQVHLVRE